MSTFKKVLADRDKFPGRHYVLDLVCFAETWQQRPQEPVRIGIRRISDAIVQTARAEAAKYAIEMHDDRIGQIESHNDALMRWMIVAASTDPEDLEKPHPLFAGSEENVRMALTSEAIRYAWEEIERFHIEVSPVLSPITDEEMTILANRLSAKPLPVDMSTAQTLRLRKLLGFVLFEISCLEEDLAVPDHLPVEEVIVDGR